jgi:hypothetical protein
MCPCTKRGSKQSIEGGKYKEKLLAFVDREKQNLKFKGLLEIVFMNRAELEKRTKTQK